MPKIALILIDIQNDYFPGGDWELHEMTAASAQAAELLRAARVQGDLVVHIRHENPNPDAPFFRTGSKGAEIHASVLPQDGEAVLTKHRPNSFHGTRLQELLQDAEVEEVILCGAMSQMCVDATARAAADFGFAVTIAEDACAARAVEFGGVSVSAEQVHAAFMAPLAMGYAKVVKAAEVLR